MKKIILILMVTISTMSFSMSITVEQFVLNKEILTQQENYNDLVVNSEKYIESIKNYSNIDYLDGSVKIEKTLWTLLEKKEKELMLLVFLIDMFDKTNSTDIRVNIDYTTVLWVFMDTVQKKRVY